MLSEQLLQNKFIVEFHGKFIPLQGVLYIIKAAEKLKNYEDIFFVIIGNGQTYKESTELAKKLDLKNINFLGRVDFNEIPEYLQKSDVCLGIFGDTGKTQRVIPNKLYESIAMAKPVITADTPAARELLTDRENILFCRVADGGDLADKILELRNNTELRDKIGKGGYNIFKEFCSPKAVGKKLIENIKQI